MAKSSNIKMDTKLKKKSEIFMNKINSDMYFQSELSSDSISFNWVNEIEFACPYIDNIIRNPKLSLINEEDIVKIEKAKKITVASVKDLSRHTHFIEKIDKKTNEVHPSKILIERNEETFNTYENRFIYTLVNNLYRFMLKKEKLLEEFETKNNKVLEYAASTDTGCEKVNIELKISSNEIPKGNVGKNFENEIDAIKFKVKRIREYISSWRRSEFIQSLEKANVAFVVPPIKKTNIILKNPNFQIGMKLWNFLQTYDDNDNNSKESIDSNGDNILKSIVDDSFLMAYYVLDSINSSKKIQKEKLHKYTIIMVHQQIQKAVSLLLNSGIKMTEEEMLSMISAEIKKEKTKTIVGSADIKKKFKSAMDEYLEKAKEYL